MTIESVENQYKKIPNYAIHVIFLEQDILYNIQDYIENVYLHRCTYGYRKKKSEFIKEH